MQYRIYIICLLTLGIHSCGVPSEDHAPKQTDKDILYSCGHDKSFEFVGLGYAGRTVNAYVYVEQATIGPIFYQVWGANWYARMKEHMHYWAVQVGLDFDFVDDSNKATMIIRGRPNPHSRELAHISGNITIVFNTYFPAINPVGVLIHELGHYLGLAHNNSSASIMHPYVGGGTVPYADDINGAKHTFSTRLADDHEGSKGNESFDDATEIASKDKKLTFAFGGIQHFDDKDFYKVSLPKSDFKNLAIEMNKSGTSLRSINLRIYDHNKTSIYDESGVTHGFDWKPNAAQRKAGYYYVAISAASSAITNLGSYTYHHLPEFED